MKFEPKTDEQLNADGLCQPGIYDAVIESVTEPTSKRGDPMFKISARVWDADAREWVVFDYVSPAWMAHKFKHFIVCALGEDRYNAGDVSAHDLVGKSLMAQVGVEGPKDDFPPKNIVKDYFPVNKESPKREMKKAEADEDLPF